MMPNDALGLILYNSLTLILCIRTRRLHLTLGKVLVLSSCFLFISCEGGSSGEECGANRSCAPPGDTPNISFLTGQWELACYLDTDIAVEIDPVYRKVVLTFSGGTTGSFSSNFSAYSSQDCAEPAIAIDSGTLTGTYILGAAFSSDEGLLVTELDLMANEITFLDGQSVSPVVDRPIDLTIAYVESNALYFGVDDDPDLEPPVRLTSVDFERAFLKQ